MKAGFLVLALLLAGQLFAAMIFVGENWPDRMTKVPVRQAVRSGLA